MFIPEALEVTLPAEAKTDYPLVLRLRGRGLAPAPAGAAVAPREPEADGRVVLRAADAEIHGDSPRYETGGGKDNIGYWANPADHVSWAFRVPRPGRYTVDVTYSCEDGREGSRFDVAVGDRTVTGASRPTGSWATFARETLGTIELDRPGVHTLAVKPRAEPRWQVIGLQAVTLIPAGP